METKLPPNLYMSTVKVGPKGQIVIPKEIRDMFNISPGDNLVIMADKERGIAINLQSALEAISSAIKAGDGSSVLPQSNNEEAAVFSQAIDAAISGKEVTR